MGQLKRYYGRKYMEIGFESGRWFTSTSSINGSGEYIDVESGWTSVDYTV
jgi:hypothetical protein